MNCAKTFSLFPAAISLIVFEDKNTACHNFIKNTNHMAQNTLSSWLCLILSKPVDNLPFFSPMCPVYLKTMVPNSDCGHSGSWAECNENIEILTEHFKLCDTLKKKRKKKKKKVESS